MSDVQNILKSIDEVSRSMTGIFVLAPLGTDADKAVALKIAKSAAERWEGIKKLAKEKDATFTQVERDQILAEQEKLAKHVAVLAGRNPEKMKLYAPVFESAKTKPVMPSSFNPDLDGSNAQGDLDGKELEKTFTDGGNTFKELLGGAKKTVSDAVDDAKELFNADGTPKTDEQKKKEAAAAAAANGGKSKGFFDSIGDWFSNVNGKDIVGGVAGGGIGYMLGKIFGEGTVGTIAGILMTVMGAVMGRQFAHNHFNGDDKGVAGKTGAGSGGDSHNGVVVPKADEVSTNYKGMTQEQLDHALAIYRQPVVKVVPEKSEEERLLDYKLAHPLVPNIGKSNQPAAQDDLYGR